VPSHTVQIMPELMDRIGLLKSETIKAVTAAYPVIGQSPRELLMLGAETLQRQDNDQLWLPIKYGPTLIRMNTAKAEYITNALKTLPRIWNRSALGESRKTAGAGLFASWRRGGVRSSLPKPPPVSESTRGAPLEVSPSWERWELG
jgi:hypothetical protein